MQVNFQVYSTDISLSLAPTTDRHQPLDLADTCLLSHLLRFICNVFTNFTLFSSKLDNS